MLDRVMPDDRSQVSRSTVREPDPKPIFVYERRVQLAPKHEPCDVGDALDCDVRDLRRR